MKKVFLIVLTSASLTGCASFQASGDRYNLDYIQDGMTKEQVVDIMREPAECHKVADEELMLWDGACVSLVNNKVVKKTTLESEESNELHQSFHGQEPPSGEFFHELFKREQRAPSSVQEEYEEE